MEEMYGLNSTTADIYSDRALMTPENLMLLPSDYCYDASPGGGDYFHHPSMMMFGSSTDEMLSAAASSEPAAAAAEREDLSSAIKAKIASHPRYPRLLQAYIDCQKVGAPPEIESILDEIMRDNDVCPQDTVISTCLGGADPELDDFMETYCDMLVKYKTDLARPFDEATTFLNKIETQLVHLCKGVSISTRSDDGGVSSEEEVSGGETETQDSQPTGDEGRDLKDRLLRKFGGHISTLKLEFSKKKKKGKLPREARQILLDWWNSHYKWPYPTEADKIALAELTSLDQKQINNWFINQRKRHWKPSESMQFGSMDNLSGQLFSDD